MNLAQVVESELVGMAHEARIGLLQQLRGDVPEVPHHQHGQQRIGSVQPRTGLHDRDGSQ
jgi:hypothetical protein